MPGRKGHSLTESAGEMRGKLTTETVLIIPKRAHLIWLFEPSKSGWALVLTMYGNAKRRFSGALQFKPSTPEAGGGGLPLWSRSQFQLYVEG